MSVEMIARYEATGDSEALQHLVETGRRSPEQTVRMLADRNREQFRINQVNRELLGEAKAALEEKERDVRHIAAYIAEGPHPPLGEPTAIVDRGGQRQVVALAAGITLEECRERSAVLLHQEGS